MTDLDTSIRQGLGYLVESTPIAPIFDEIGARAIPARRRYRWRFRIGGGVLAALLALGVPAVALEATNPFAHSYQAGDELTARYGLSVSPAKVGRQSSAALPFGLRLRMEVERRHGLVQTPGEYLPTGPLGPVYMQLLSNGVVVMTVQPQDAIAAARSASGARKSIAVRVGGLSGRLWKPRGETDSLALSWQPSPTVGVVLATGSFGAAATHRLERLATEVKPLKKVPELAVSPMSLHGGGGMMGGYWSLVSPPATRFAGSTWDRVIDPSFVIGNLMGDVISQGSTAGQRWTARVTGDPATGYITIGGEGVRVANDQPVFPTGLAGVTEAAAGGGPTAASNPDFTVRLIEGSVPERVTAVRIVLSDGTSHLVRTVKSGHGWNRRLFGTALPVQTANVIRIEGIDATGHVLVSYSYPFALQGDFSSDFG